MMKLFFASDIHGSLPATERMLERFVSFNADWLILLGDLLYHGPRNPLPEGYDPAGVAQLLNQHAQKIIAVRGNCDSEVDQMLISFPIMASWQQILTEQHRLFLTHGHEYCPDNLPPLSPNDMLVYGHTHIPQAEKIGDIYCFNPGSISLPKGGYPPSFGILTDNRLQVLDLQNQRIILQTHF